MKQEKTKNRFCDLHTHTEYSDGIFLSPKDSLRFAFLNGINVYSITDHDNYRGYFDALEEAKNLGMTLLPGAEITTPDYHLLALNFNPHDKDFRNFLKRSMGIQEEKCRLRIDRLIEHGIPISMDYVSSIFPPEIVRIGKYNLFVSMMFNPECRERIESETPEMNFYERFRHYLGSSGVAGNIPDAGVLPKEAIDATHAAGGFIGIAHPFKDVYNISEMDTLVELGIDFIEIQPNYRGKENKVYTNSDFENYALKRGLPVSFGSDYHGPSFYRKMLERGENILHEDLEELLNCGYVKIKSRKLEKICL